LDTKRAYECLNLAPDARSYSAAAAVLKKALDPGCPIRLLSNNKEKEDGLRREGVNITERVRLICGWEFEDVRRYLVDKRKALGHDIPLGIDEHE
jgi:GTP cyclohydrolase II